ncbi:tetratricopeptide repeat-containing sulfotransferase family protein [Zavarzinia sp. CC-PAN008]|uniref:tetratricopeptide repeat-containing sulfotransferase family protein n=1 Tax=Zavarzinia sp. CC-PAN008 TaxID=3243332 RepID=UPI003F7486B4
MTLRNGSPSDRPPASPQAARQAIASRLQAAIAAHRQGALEEAARHYRAVLAADPRQADALHLLGLVFHQAGQPQDALPWLDKAIAVQDRNPVFLANRARVLEALGRREEAIAALRASLDVDPGYVSALLDLTAALLASGAVDEAAAHALHASELAPDQLRTWTLLAEATAKQGREVAARDALAQARRLAPGDLRLALTHGRALLAVGDEEGAATAFRDAAALAPQDAEVWLLLGTTLRDLGALEEALPALRRARDLAAGPGGNAPAIGLQPLAQEARTLDRLGRAEQALALLEPELWRRPADPSVALAFAQVGTRAGRRDEALALLDSALGDTAMTPHQRRMVHFARGRLLDEAERHDEAFAAYADGNATAQARLDRLAYDAYVAGVTEVFGPHGQPALCRLAPPRDRVRPVLIVGMVRSGTTLVEQILASHPQVAAGGELGAMPDAGERLGQALGGAFPDSLARAGADDLARFAADYRARLDALAQGRPVVTDKLPGNFQHLGLAWMALPDAAVIHCRRHPLDTILSAYFQNFRTRHAYADDLDDLVFFYRRYAEMMAVFRTLPGLNLLEVDYEALVAEPERVARAIVAHAGLDWDPACLDFHRNPRFVRTASWDQVNRPIYDRSVGRWRRYAQALEPVRRQLDSAGLLPPD